MDLGALKKKYEKGEKLTAGERFFLKKNGVDIEVEDTSPESKEKTIAAETESFELANKKIDEEKEKDEPKTKPREVTVEEFAPRQARDKNKKPEKKKRKKKESKFPKFWQDFSAEYKITWAVLGGLMVIGVGIGFFLPNDLKIIFLEQIFDKFSGLLEGVSTTWQLALSIFWNNLVVSFYLFMLGVTLIVPGLIILSNGLMIGIFFDYLVRLETMEPGILITSFVALLPHGIFEIPAFIMAAGLGTNLLIKLIFHKKFIKDKSRKRVLLDMVLRYAFIIIPLFFVAALV
ncbi:stage II sporulation protein M [Patescibacteria group bacterium]|nr:stage II sporulation protein M [Patescibacteria group bacterium]